MFLVKKLVHICLCGILSLTQIALYIAQLILLFLKLLYLDLVDVLTNLLSQ